MKPIQISVDDDYNLKDFYTIKQVHGLLELPWRMQIHRRFEARGIPSYNFSKMTLFKRTQVDEYLWENCPNNYRDKVALRESLLRTPAFNIRTREWWPKAWAVEYAGVYFQTIYNIIKQEGIYRNIRNIKFFSIVLFNKEDLFRWENREIPERFRQ